MTEIRESSRPYTAEQIRAQAAALAAHLDRCGIHWLPNPRAEAVESLAAIFARPSSAAEPDANRAAETSQPSRRSTDSPPSPVARPAAVPSSGSLFGAGVGEDDSRGSYPGEPFPVDQRQAQLDQINSEVSVCTRCETLSSCRRNTVFGEGHVAPRVVFFGEGPGADEDRTGRPFVGRAGELLTRMIQACSFQREEVYIMNTVKCRPPGNRNPEPDELANCREYYQRQLAILRPEYIVCLGAVSAQELLSSKLPVGRLRGRFHAYFESKVVVTYHPAYLLRNPSAKKATWTDLQMMLRDAGIQVG